MWTLSRALESVCYAMFIVITILIITDSIHSSLYNTPYSKFCTTFHAEYLFIGALMFLFASGAANEWER